MSFSHSSSQTEGTGPHVLHAVYSGASGKSHSPILKDRLRRFRPCQEGFRLCHEKEISPMPRGRDSTNIMRARFRSCREGAAAGRPHVQSTRHWQYIDLPSPALGPHTPPQHHASAASPLESTMVLTVKGEWCPPSCRYTICWYLQDALVYPGDAMSSVIVSCRTCTYYVTRAAGQCVRVSETGRGQCQEWSTRGKGGTLGR